MAKDWAQEAAEKALEAKRLLAKMKQMSAAQQEQNEQAKMEDAQTPAWQQQMMEALAQEAKAQQSAALSQQAAALGAVTTYSSASALGKIPAKLHRTALGTLMPSLSVEQDYANQRTLLHIGDDITIEVDDLTGICEVFRGHKKLIPEAPPPPLPEPAGFNNLRIDWLREAREIADKSGKRVTFDIEREGIVTRARDGERHCQRLVTWAMMEASRANPLIKEIELVGKTLEVGSALKKALERGNQSKAA